MLLVSSELPGPRFSCAPAADDPPLQPQYKRQTTGASASASSLHFKRLAPLPHRPPQPPTTSPRRSTRPLPPEHPPQRSVAPSPLHLLCHSELSLLPKTTIELHPCSTTSIQLPGSQTSPGASSRRRLPLRSGPANATRSSGASCSETRSHA